VVTKHVGIQTEMYPYVPLAENLAIGTIKCYNIQDDSTKR